ncbi:MAG: hypothetical protein ACK559_04420, partial [bacterium]
MGATYGSVHSRTKPSLNKYTRSGSTDVTTTYTRMSNCPFHTHANTPTVGRTGAYTTFARQVARHCAVWWCGWCWFVNTLNPSMMNGVVRY